MCEFCDKPGVATMIEVQANLDAAHECKWKSLAGELNQTITELLKEKYRNRERPELNIQKKAREAGLCRIRKAPIEKFLIVASALDGDTLITPELMNELIEIAARLEEIERKSNGKL